MTPDDPRHGSTAGHIAHRKANEPACLPCVAAKTRYEKHRNVYGDRMIPALGTRRRIRALMAMGHSGADIATHLGVTYQAVHKLKTSTADKVRAATAANVAAVYEQLSMTIPTGYHRARIRNAAQRQGWSPPLAFDDIDDPLDDPADWHYTPAARADQLADLVASGVNLTHACRRLGIAVNTLNKWCIDTGNSHLYRTLAAREGDWNSGGRIARDGAA